MNGRAVRVALAGAVAVLALVGCSGADDAATGGGMGEAPAGAARDESAQSGGFPGSAPAAGKDDTGTGSAGTAPLKLEPAVIRTAEQHVVVDDVPARAGEAIGHARAAGGITAGDERSGTGRTAQATLVLKVPPARMDGLLDQLGRLGEERQRNSTSQDVTEDVADVSSRVATMQASIARVRAILSRADKIGDVVAVESELSRRVTELESLQARQRALATQVGYATVTVRLSDRGDASLAAPAEDRSGFLGGLRDGWSAFGATVGWLLTGLGAVLPFLLVLLPAAYGIRWAARRGRRPAPPAAEPPAPATAH